MPVKLLVTASMARSRGQLVKRCGVGFGCQSALGIRQHPSKCEPSPLRIIGYCPSRSSVLSKGCHQSAGVVAGGEATMHSRPFAMARGIASHQRYPVMKRRLLGQVALSRPLHRLHISKSRVAVPRRAVSMSQLNRSVSLAILTVKPPRRAWHRGVRSRAGGRAPRTPRSPRRSTRPGCNCHTCHRERRPATRP